MTFADCRTIAAVRFGSRRSGADWERLPTAHEIGIVAGENGADFPNPYPQWHPARLRFESGRDQGRRNAERRAPKQGVLI